MSRYWTSALAIVAVAVGGSISACSNGDREQGATPLVASSTDATTDATTDDSDGTRSSTPPQPVETSVAATAPPQSTYGTTTMTAPTSPIVFPPPPLPLQPPTELSIGEPDLVGLIEGGEWLFAISPPSVAVRIDPSSGDVERLDVRVGESREGAAGHAYVGDRLWILGGPFRDTLVEIDPTAMTETRRIQLDEDHGLRQNGPSGSMWLTTFRGVRPVDIETGDIGTAVELEVDPSDVAVTADDVWVTLPAASQVARIDPADGSYELFDTEPGPTNIVVHDNVVWITHPPTASISRLDATTGALLGVVDLDIGGDVATATNIAGLDAAGDSVWAVAQYAGAPVEPVMFRIDVETGEIRSARTIHIESNTWEATNDRLWFHRAGHGSLVAVDVDEFDQADPTPESELAPTTTSAPTTTPADLSTDEAAVAEAFERFIDETIASDEVGLDSTLTATRGELLDLLNAQVGGEARLDDITADADTALVRFDVVVEGETVALPGIELVFRRTVTSGWTVDPISMCALAAGVGIACP